jgi:surface polysaccharide O-acyltransferase-like enzyme
MVIVVHCTEPFYIGGSESFILTGSDAFWASFFDSFVRACVPMFVVASSYLLFPTRYTTAQFLKKRTIRVLVPFLIWSLIYASAWGDPVENLKNLLLNFNYSAGHLWFVYMLIGVYLLIPLLSPWAEKVEKKELLVYLGIWMFSNIIPLIRDYVSADPLAGILSVRTGDPWTFQDSGKGRPKESAVSGPSRENQRRNRSHYLV